MKIVGQIQLYSSHIYRYVMVLHLAEMDVLALIIACSLYVVPIFVFSSQFLYKKNPQEACAYCLLPRNNSLRPFEARFGLIVYQVHVFSSDQIMAFLMNKHNDPKYIFFTAQTCRTCLTCLHAHNFQPASTIPSLHKLSMFH